MISQAIKAVLEREGISVVGEAADGRQAVDLIIELQPDIALLHAHMPLLNGFDAARKLRKLNASTRVLLVSSQPQLKTVSEVISSGVAAYLPMTLVPSQLITIVQAVRQGAVYVHPGAEPDADRGPSAVHPEELLSLREREVLQLICEGKVSKEIAGMVGISTKTAESYRHRIVTKLGVSKVSGLVRYAVRTGLIQAAIVMAATSWGASA